MDWALQGKPNRSPCLPRATLLGATIRQSEWDFATGAEEFAPTTGISPDHALLSCIHDTLGLSHDRDMRFFHFFLAPAIRLVSNVEIRAIELSEKLYCAIAHVPPSSLHDSEVLYLIAAGVHMHWGKVTNYANPVDWRDWETSVSEVPVRDFSPSGTVVVDDSYLLAGSREACRFCGIILHRCGNALHMKGLVGVPEAGFSATVGPISADVWGFSPPWE